MTGHAFPFRYRDFEPWDVKEVAYARRHAGRAADKAARAAARAKRAAAAPAPQSRAWEPPQVKELLKPSSQMVPLFDSEGELHPELAASGTFTLPACAGCLHILTMRLGMGMGQALSTQRTTEHAAPHLDIFAMRRRPCLQLWRATFARTPWRQAEVTWFKWMTCSAKRCSRERRSGCVVVFVG